jgi:hypothetical protein
MNGRPVWLASVSRWNGGKIVPAERWGPGTIRASVEVAHRVLEGVGDPSLERGFRMCTTLCFHRGLTDVEIAELPPGPGGLAGPPGLDVVWETPDVPPVSLSFTACAHRRFERVRGATHTLKLPVDDCTDPTCLSCRARDRVLGRTG